MKVSPKVLKVFELFSIINLLKMQCRCFIHINFYQSTQQLEKSDVLINGKIERIEYIYFSHD